MSTGDVCNPKYSRYEWGNIYNTDFLSAAPRLPNAIIDTTILHPPALLILEDGKEREYIEYMQWCRSWAYHVNRMSKPNAVAWILGNNDTLLSVGQIFLGLGWRTLNIIRLVQAWKVWPPVKTHWDDYRAKYCLFMAKSARGHYFDFGYARSIFSSRLRNSWYVYDLREDEVKFGRHPEQLSDELVDIMVRTCVPEDGAVLDPFAGSGTTSVVAERAIRKWIAFEKNAEWCKVANKRVLAVRLNMMGGKR